MIIKLHDDFISMPTSDLKKYTIPIFNMLDAHANRWHLFICERSLAKSILELCGNDTRRKSAAVNIIQNYGQVSGLLSTVDDALVFYDPKSMNVPSGRNLRPVDISKAKDLTRLSPVRVLVEDSRYDKYIIDQILEAMRVNGKIPPVQLQVRYKHCGGSGYIASIGDVLMDESMFICVVDTDMKSPFSPMGDTARSVIDFMNKSGNSNCLFSFILTTPSKEIENLIPPLVYERIWATSPERQGKITAIRKLFPDWPNLRGVDKDLYKYFDFKRGFNLDSEWTTSCSKEEGFKDRMMKTCEFKAIKGLSSQIVQELMFAVEKHTNRKKSQLEMEFLFKSNPMNEDIFDFASRIFSVSIHNPSII